MKITIKVVITEEEKNILKTAANILSDIADDIENENIETFAGMDLYDFNRLSSYIEDIIDTIENSYNEKEEN